MDTSFFGIDFGTTNSALVAYTGMPNTGYKITPYGDDAGYPLPSLVAIKKDGTEIKTGRDIKDLLNSGSEKVKDFFEQYEYIPSVKMILKEDTEWHIGDKIYKPVDIAAELFKSLKNEVVESGDDIVSSVVAIPVGFTANEKEKLRKAANMAGFKIKMFISEPTAAFCANYDKLKMYNNIAVFDWGGGTLDVAILNVTNGRISEIATEGISLAGNDVDKIFAKRINNKVGSKLSMEELKIKYPGTYSLLLAKCEHAKCNFSDNDIVQINMNSYADIGAVRVGYEYDNFKDLIDEEIIAKAVECLKKALKTAHLNKETIDCILCVGGSSKLRPLRDALRQEYDEEKLFFPDDTMWTIAKGAAYIALHPGKYALNKPIGLLLCDDSFHPLLRKGDALQSREINITLALTEDDDNEKNSAKFIFTDSDKETERTFTEYVSVPVRYFDDEIIKLSCYIDPNFTFRAKIESNKKAFETIYTYDKVMVYYDMEV